MKAIQKELGRKDEKGNEVDDLKKKIRTGPDAEGRRGEGHPGAQAPRGHAADVGRGHRLPQLPRLADRGAVAQRTRRAGTSSGRRDPHEDHYGLDKIKERILEFLAVRALVKKPKATILTFSGLPAWARPRSPSRSRGR